MVKTQIDAVAFDYGNVLSCPQDPNRIERLATLAHLPAHEFAQRYTQNRLAYDRGVLTGTQYWEKLLADTDVQVTSELVAQLIQTDVSSWLRLN